MNTRTIINFVIAILVIVLFFFGYQYLFGPKQSTGTIAQTGALAPGGGSRTSSDATAFLSVIAGLRTLTLDTSLFSNQAFTSLTDFGVTLSPEPVRNSNPFVPFGGSSAVSEDSNGGI
jgi:hypothetical protein